MAVAEGVGPPRRVPSAGLVLVAREHSPWAPGRESLVLVHGYPDQQDVWLPVIEALPSEQLQIITYDVRGAGASDAPTHTAGYRTELLVEDLVSVVEAMVPAGRPVHLVGHDWGSVQLWDVVAAADSDPRLSGRVASFTSMSGPSLDHMARLSRQWRGRASQLAEQMVRSWYVQFFELPVLPEGLWRLGAGPFTAAAARIEGHLGGHWGPGLPRDAVNGLGLYRANVTRRMRRPEPLYTDVPVLLVHPTKDPFLTSLTYEDLEAECSDLRVELIDAGHWLIRTHATEVADLVHQHVQQHSTQD